MPAVFGGRTAKAERIPGLFCSLSAGSFAQSSLGHSSAEMPRVTLSCLFVWAASQAASSRNNGIFSFVCAGKIKCDLNWLLDLHQVSPPRAQAVRQLRRGSPSQHSENFPHRSGTGRAARRSPPLLQIACCQKAAQAACHRRGWWPPSHFLLHPQREQEARDVHLRVLRDAPPAHAHPRAPHPRRELGCPPQNSLDSGPSHDLGFGPAPGP